MQVGFIGMGQMGAAMAANLLAAGHAVTVFNRTPEKAAPLEQRGARVAGDDRRGVPWRGGGDHAGG